MKSIKDFRDENLIRQQYDYSCGAAALATLLRYGLGVAVTERQIVNDLLSSLSADQSQTRQREGFSLFDLQQVAEKRGYSAQGFQLEPAYLAQLKGPVIVYLETQGYKHFAVLKGISGDRVYLADPSRGNIRMPAYRFLEAWLRDGEKGIVFIVEAKAGGLTQQSVLRAPLGNVSQPEILAVRELLATGPSFSRTN